MPETPVPETVRCPAVTEEGTPCQRRCHVDSAGIVDVDHAGGHFYATDSVWAAMNNNHIDATALLSGVPASVHSPAECPGWPACASAPIPTRGRS